MQPDLAPMTLSARPFVEIALPMPVSHAWVAYACRSAGVAKPRWNPSARVWTTTVKGTNRPGETISITSGAGPRSVRIQADPLPSAEPHDDTARRLATAFVTGMQWALRQRS